MLKDLNTNNESNQNSMDMYPVRGYWKHKHINGLFNVDCYGNAFRVKRCEVLGRGLMFAMIKRGEI